MIDILTWAIEKIGTGGVASAIVIIVILFMGVGWLFARAKDNVEIRNLKAQIATSIGSVMLNHQESRQKYTHNAARCGVLASKIANLIRDNAQLVEIDAIREELASCLSNDTAPAYLNECEWRRLDLEISEASLDSYRELLVDATAELHRFRKWLTIINHPNFLRYLSKEPLNFQIRTFRPLLSTVEKFPKEIRNDQMRAARQLIDYLIAPFPSIAA